MKMKELEALFDSQPARQLVSDHKTKKGKKKTEVTRIGVVFYKLRMTTKEYAKRQGGLTAKRWARMPEVMELTQQISRQHLKTLKKLNFEGFTGAGWPIFQTKKYAKAVK